MPYKGGLNYSFLKNKIIQCYCMAVEMHGQKVKKKYMLNQINPYVIFPPFLICEEMHASTLASRRALKGSVHFRFKQIRKAW